MSHYLGRPACVAAIVLLTCSAAVCDGGDSPAPVITVNPSPSGVPLKTIANRTAGERITVTARLDRVLGNAAFVVRDVDLPVQGLLVLGPLPEQARPPALVTVTGVITVYHFAEVRDNGALAPFQGRKIVVADSVRSWA